MNQLKSGMIFKNSKEVSKFLGYKDISHSNLNLQRLSHYCDFTRDENYVITILKVFENPVPFKQMDFRYKVGDIITTNNSTFKILKCYKDYDGENHKTKFYQCQCLKDDYIFNIRESRISSMNIGCPICGNRKLIIGKTSLYDEHPEVLKYLVDENDAKNVTSQNSKKILCKCPICGYIKKVAVNNLVNHGFSCSICSDGISYPNKFIRSLLMQLNIEFIPEKKFFWSNNRIYDIYIPVLNIIIENHGEQHYVKKIGTIFKGLEYEQKNDVKKKEMALKNNISEYIVIDCSKSNKEFIKKSIMSSKLPKLLNFKESDIDWNKCDLFAANTFVKTICEEWEKNKNITDLKNKYHLAFSTIRNYLKVGSENNLCSYTKFPHTIENQKNTRDAHSKPIYCETNNMYFYSSRLCQEYFEKNGEKFNGKTLYRYINNKQLYHNKKFVYITKNHFNEIKEKSLNNQSFAVYGDFYGEQYI